MIYQVETIDGKYEINEWLKKMSFFKSFKAISVSAQYGCGYQFRVLYSISKRDFASSLDDGE